MHSEITQIAHSIESRPVTAAFVALRFGFVADDRPRQDRGGKRPRAEAGQ